MYPPTEFGAYKYYHTIRFWFLHEDYYYIYIITSYFIFFFTDYNGINLISTKRTVSFFKDGGRINKGGWFWRFYLSSIRLAAQLSPAAAKVYVLTAPILAPNDTYAEIDVLLWVVATATVRERPNLSSEETLFDISASTTPVVALPEAGVRKTLITLPRILPRLSPTGQQPVSLQAVSLLSWAKVS